LTVLAFLSLLALWFIRFQTSQIALPPQPAQVGISYQLETEPKISGQFQEFQVGQVRIKTTRFPEYHTGDQLYIAGKLQNNQILFPKISQLTSEAARPGLSQTLSQTRANLIEKINLFLPTPQSNLVAGILLGQDAIRGDFLNDLRKTGLVHIVVVSGQNISILAGMALSVLAPLIGRRKAIVIAGILVIFYTLMVGAQPPVVRAAIMGLLTFSALYFGRQVWSVWILGLTGVLMILVDPSLPFSISFQLSMAATFGVIAIAPKLEEKLKKLPNIIKSDLSVSLSAYLMTLPIIVYHFGQASVVAPVANLLVIWLVAPIMFMGMIMVAVGSILPILGMIVGWILWVPTTFFVNVAQGFASLPFASFTLGKGIWQLSVGYLILLFLILKQTLFRAKNHEIHSEDEVNLERGREGHGL